MNKRVGLRDVMLNASISLIILLFTSKVLGYAYNVAFARLFSQETYGTFVYVFSLALFLCGFMIPNISSSMIRYIAYYRGQRNREYLEKTIRTGYVLNIVLTSAAIIVLSALYLSGFFPLKWTGFAFLCSIVFLNSMASFTSGIIAGYRHPEVSAFFLFIQQLLRLLAVIMAGLVWASLEGVMALVGLGFLVYTLVVAAYEIRKYGLGAGLDIGIGGKLLSFGLFCILYQTAHNILSWGDIFLIKHFLGAAKVAVYNVAWLVSTMTQVFFLAVLQIFSPVVSELFGAKQKEKIQHLSSYLLETFFVLFLPVFAAFILFAREILVVFFNAEYAEGANALKILSLGAMLFGAAMLFIQLIQAMGKPQVNAKIIGTAAALNLGLNTFLIPSHGLEGAAYATLASSLAALLMSYAYVKPSVRVIYSKKRLAKTVLCTILCVACALTTKAALADSIVSLIASSAVLIFAYFTSLTVLKALRQEDVDLADAVMEKAKTPKPIRQNIHGILMRGVA